jgi:hypothetical protein
LSDGLITVGSASRIREKADFDSELLGQIPVLKVIEVLRDTYCADSYLWRGIAYNSRVGWTVRADGHDHLVESYIPVEPQPVGEIADTPDGLALDTDAVAFAVPLTLFNHSETAMVIMQSVPGDMRPNTASR